MPLKTSVKYSPYSLDKLQEAYVAVKNNIMSINKAAKHYGIPRSTLGDKVRGTRSIQPPVKTVLTREEEQMIVDWVTESARRGHRITQNHIGSRVQQILNSAGRVTKFVDNKPSKVWFYRFLKRHPEIGLPLPTAALSEVQVVPSSTPTTVPSSSALTVSTTSPSTGKTPSSASASTSSPAIVTSSTSATVATSSRPYLSHRSTSLEFKVEPATPEPVPRSSSCAIDAGSGTSTDPSSATVFCPSSVISFPWSTTSSPTSTHSSHSGSSKMTLMSKLLVMVNGWSQDKFFDIMREKSDCLPPNEDDAEYQNFSYLFDQFVPRPSLQAVPLPESFDTVTKVKQPPRAKLITNITGEHAVSSYFDEKTSEEKDRTKETPREKKEIADIRQKIETQKLEDKDNKIAEREARKAEEKMRKIKRLAKRKNDGSQGMSKKRKIEVSLSKSKKEEESGFMGDSLLVVLEYDENTCCVCGGFKKESSLVGCQCGRRYHKECAWRSVRNQSLLSMNEKELEECEFVCDFCL